MDKNHDKPKYYPVDELIQKLVAFLESKGIVIPEFEDETTQLIWLNEQCLKIHQGNNGHRYFVTITSQDEDPSCCIGTYHYLRERYNVEHACLELTKEGKPHVHVLLQTDKYLNKEHIYKKNGKNYVDVRKVRTELDKVKVSKYIHKAESKPSTSYLTRWGLDPEDPLSGAIALTSPLSRTTIQKNIS